MVKAGEALLTISVLVQPGLHMLGPIGRPPYIGILRESRAKFPLCLGSTQLRSSVHCWRQFGQILIYSDMIYHEIVNLIEACLR